MASPLDLPSRAGAAARPPLGFLLRQAAAAHRLKIDQALADLNVTAPQFLVLRLLSQNVGASNAEVARMTGLTTPTISVIVANLKRRGAVLNRPHAIHGRVQHLDLTEGGEKLLSACDTHVERVEADLQAGLAPAKLAAIYEWLFSVTP